MKHIKTELLVLATSVFACAAFGAPIKNPANAHLYEVLRGPGWSSLKWHEAAQRVRALPPIAGKRAQLVTLGSYNEEAFLLSQFGTKVNRCWLGGFRLNQNSSPYGQWAWVDGTRFSYTNWHPGEGGNQGGRKEWYLVYWGTGSMIKTAGWGDISANFLADGVVVEYQ
jgi:hypothetical protein